MGRFFSITSYRQTSQSVVILSVRCSFLRSFLTILFHVFWGLPLTWVCSLSKLISCFTSAISSQTYLWCVIFFYSLFPFYTRIARLICLILPQKYLVTTLYLTSISKLSPKPAAWTADMLNLGGTSFWIFIWLHLAPLPLQGGHVSPTMWISQQAMVIISLQWRSEMQRVMGDHRAGFSVISNRAFWGQESL